MTDVIAERAADAAGASVYLLRHPADYPHHLPSRLYVAEESERLAEFLEHVEVIVSLHGYGRLGRSTQLLAGGGNRALAEHVAAHFDVAGYTVVTDLDAMPRELRGLHPDNPVNRARGGGTQLELSPRLRGISPRSAPPEDDGLVPTDVCADPGAGGGCPQLGADGHLVLHTGDPSARPPAPNTGCATNGLARPRTGALSNPDHPPTSSSGSSLFRASQLQLVCRRRRTARGAAVVEVLRPFRGCRPLRRRTLRHASPTHRPLPRVARHRAARRHHHGAATAEGARVRLQPAEPVLVPRRQRCSPPCPRRGAQPTRRPTHLPATARLRRADDRPEAALCLALQRRGRSLPRPGAPARGRVWM